MAALLDRKNGSQYGTWEDDNDVSYVDYRDGSITRAKRTLIKWKYTVGLLSIGLIFTISAIYSTSSQPSPLDGAQASSLEDLYLNRFTLDDPKNKTTPFKNTDHKPPAPTQYECEPPYPGYPRCEEKVTWLTQTWNATVYQKAYYLSHGMDGSLCSMLDFLNTNGFYCPAAVDAHREKIRGVNIGGWLVLEPWVTPSLFEQFDPEDHVQDQWTFCKKLGHDEAHRQLEKHWDTWLTEDDLRTLAENGINHLRIPVGYWILDDVREGEPWVTGGIVYLKRAIGWAKKLGLFVVIDLHCGPGSQNGFDNSGRKGELHWADPVFLDNGTVRYPNIERTLNTVRELTSVFTSHPYEGTVVAFELINEAFISIDLQTVKQYYLDGYAVVRSVAPLAVVIGDSFRFQAWDNFMFPPLYDHVWIDTHIYHVFDMNVLSNTWQDHVNLTCTQSLPTVAVSPLSTMVGEWSLATTDCAKWLNGYGTGSRYDGTFDQSWFLGSCDGENDTRTYDPYYRKFLSIFAETQMDAYESGSSAGWFFWNFKTETAPEWNYLKGIEEGWIPKNISRPARKYNCDDPMVQAFMSNHRGPFPP